MREVFAGFGVVVGTVAAISVVIILSWGGYLVYLHFVEGPAITQHAQNIRHSLNFVQAANQRAEDAIAEFQADAADNDTAHANADRIQACSAASTITTAEQQPNVQAFVLAHCGAGQ